MCSSRGKGKNNYALGMKVALEVSFPVIAKTSLLRVLASNLKELAVSVCSV